MRVVSVEPGRGFAMVVRLPLAALRIEHALEVRDDGGSTVRYALDLSGPLAFLWRRGVTRGGRSGLQRGLQFAKCKWSAGGQEPPDVVAETRAGAA